METVIPFNYSTIQSKEDIKTWLTQSTQTIIDESKAYVYIDDDKNIWIEQFNIKIGFNCLVILKLKDGEKYACHSVSGYQFIDPSFPFPNSGKYDSYEEMINTITNLYSSGWKLE